MFNLQLDQVPGRLFFSPEGDSMLATFTGAGNSIERGDQIIKVGRREIRSQDKCNSALEQFKPGDNTTIEYIQRVEKLSTKITFIENPKLKVSRIADDELNDKQKEFLLDWVGDDKPEKNTSIKE